MVSENDMTTTICGRVSVKTPDRGLGLVSVCVLTNAVLAMIRAAALLCPQVTEQLGEALQQMQNQVQLEHFVRFCEGATSRCGGRSETDTRSGIVMGSCI